jgi:hypothetical protein
MSGLASFIVPRFNEGGLVEAGNIDLLRRRLLPNPDGSVSTIESISIGTDRGEILIPTISPEGARLSDEEAVELFETTGQHLGIFTSSEAASEFARRLSTMLGQSR